MSTLKIEIRNSKFVSHNDVNIEKFTEKYVKGNGWECTIWNNGNFSCKDVRGRKLMTKNGWLQRKCGSEIERLYRIKDETINGVIGLPDDYSDKRKPYFREADFQEFLDKYGLSSVRYQSANAVYSLSEDIKEGETIYIEEIKTDGRQEIITMEANAENGLLLERCRVNVADATWVVKTSTKLGEVKSRVLYTSENPRELIGLPMP